MTRFVWEDNPSSRWRENGRITQTTTDESATREKGPQVPVQSHQTRDSSPCWNSHSMKVQTECVKKEKAVFTPRVSLLSRSIPAAVQNTINRVTGKQRNFIAHVSQVNR